MFNGYRGNARDTRAPAQIDAANVPDFQRRAVLETILAAVPGSDAASQCRRALAGLSRSPLTSHEMQTALGVYYPPARIMALRAQGHRITTHWRTVQTDCGSRHRVGLYVLEPQAGSEVAQ